jgi:hypothetical protein
VDERWRRYDFVGQDDRLLRHLSEALLYPFFYST